MTGALVSTKWVMNNLSDQNVKILDASLHMPNSGRNAYEEYCSGHIKGAQFFDIDSIANLSSPLPHTMPENETFSKRVGDLGISNKNHVVIYDNSLLHSGLRAWWMFKAFGHVNVSYMDGGLKNWLNEGYPLTSDAKEVEKTHYLAQLQAEMLWFSNDIKENLTLKNHQLIDARAVKRFYAEGPEPRKGLRSGHIPHSLNIPYNTLFEDNGCLKNSNKIRKIFITSGLDLSKPVVTTCGSGITACSLVMGLHLLGKDDVSVYDGSWAEWGALDNEEYPIETDYS